MDVAALAVVSSKKQLQPIAGPLAPTCFLSRFHRPNSPLIPTDFALTDFALTDFALTDLLVLKELS
jgi:hypothetical protein